MVADKLLPPPAQYLLADHCGLVVCVGQEVRARLEHCARIASKLDVSAGPVIRAASDVVRDWMQSCENGDVIQLPMIQLTIIRIGNKPDSVMQVIPDTKQAEPRIVTA